MSHIERTLIQLTQQELEAVLGDKYKNAVMSEVRGKIYAFFGAAHTQTTTDGKILYLQAAKIDQWRNDTIGATTTWDLKGERSLNIKLLLMKVAQQKNESPEIKLLSKHNIEKFEKLLQTVDSSITINRDLLNESTEQSSEIAAQYYSQQAVLEALNLPSNIPVHLKKMLEGLGWKGSNQDFSTNIITKLDNYQKLSDVIKTKELDDFFQIDVLDQHFRDGGENECGFHAFKNGILGVQLGFKLENHTVDCFRDEKIFNEITKPLPNEPEGDLSIAQLHTALKENYSKLYERHSITLLNLHESKLCTGGFDSETVVYAGNFVEIANAPGPLTHAFIVGDGVGHWVTLILQKDEKGTMTWYGCDSYCNQSTTIKKCVSELNIFLRDPEKLQNQLVTIYDSATGSDLKRKCGWIGTNDKQHLEQKSKEYISRVQQAFDFMTRAGWFQNPLRTNDQIKQHIENLQKIAEFFKLDLQI